MSKYFIRNRYDKKLSNQEVIDRIEKRAYSDTIFKETESVYDSSVDKIVLREKINDKKLAESFEHFKMCDETGEFFKKMKTSSNNNNKYNLLSNAEDGKIRSSENKRAIAEIIAIKDYYTETFLNKGFTPDNRLLTVKDFYEEMKTVKEVLKDNYNVGGALTVTNQSITWAALELLPTEPSIHEYFTITIGGLKPGSILAFPYAQFNAPGGLDVGDEKADLMSVQIGTGYDSLTTLGKAGIKVQLGYEEMERTSFDLLSLHFQAAKNALQQWKAMKAINTVHNSAQVDFDNLDPANSSFGETSGVSLLAGGGKNGTLTMRDIEKILLNGIRLGHEYDVALISPEAWMAIMNMPELSDYIKKNHKVLFPKFKGATGTIGRAEPSWRKFKNNGSENAEHNVIKPVLPSGFTDVPLTWIVTKHVPTFFEGDKIYKTYSLKSGQGTDYYLDGGGVPVVCGKDPVTSIYFLDSKQALYYAETKPLSMLDREDDWKETYEAKMIEGYVFVPLRKGSAIRAIKNITISEEPTVDLYQRMTFTYTEAKAILAP